MEDHNLEQTAAITRHAIACLGEAWAARDAELVAGLFAPDGRYSASLGPEPGKTAVGREAIQNLVQLMFDQDSGAKTEILEEAVEGSLAFWTWRYTLPSGSIELGSDLLIVENGLIVLKDAYRKVRVSD